MEQVIILHDRTGKKTLGSRISTDLVFVIFARLGRIILYNSCITIELDGKKGGEATGCFVR